MFWCPKSYWFWWDCLIENPLILRPTIHTRKSVRNGNLFYDPSSQHILTLQANEIFIEKAAAPVISLFFAIYCIWLVHKIGPKTSFIIFIISQILFICQIPLGQTYIYAYVSRFLPFLQSIFLMLLPYWTLNLNGRQKKKNKYCCCCLKWPTLATEFSTNATNFHIETKEAISKIYWYADTQKMQKLLLLFFFGQIFTELPTLVRWCLLTRVKIN